MALKRLCNDCAPAARRRVFKVASAAFLLGVSLTLLSVFALREFGPDTKVAPDAAPSNPAIAWEAHRAGVLRILEKAEATAATDPSEENVRHARQLRQHYDTMTEPSPAALGLNAPKRPAPIYIKSVSGASGDGNIALQRAVIEALSDGGATVVDSATPCAVVVTATVGMTPAETTDRIDIEWSMLSTADIFIGAVKQNNSVASGVLDKAWGRHAVQAARGARDGLLRLQPGRGPDCP